MRKILWLCALLLCVSLRGAETLLETAKKLAESDYKGYIYTDPGNPSPKQIDCTTFLAAVLKKSLKRELTKAEYNAVQIIGLDTTKLDQLVKDSDPGTKGAVRAMVDLAKVAEVVAPADIKAGDMVQFWELKSNGHWEGHAAIVNEVTPVPNAAPKATLFGAHKSLGKIGVSDYAWSFAPGDKRRTYVARMKP